MAKREKEPLLDRTTDSIQISSSLDDDHWRNAKLVADARLSFSDRPGVKRRARGRRVLEQEEEDPERPRRSFCRSWCEMWFHVAKSRISCSICTAILWVFGVTLILVTVFSGLDECPTLIGASAFCYMIACLALSLGLLCCCYHWVRQDEDLPHALFCMAYCLLVLFIFASVAGTTAVFTHYDTLSNGSHYDTHSHKDVPCGMTHLPVAVMVLSFILGAFFVVMSYVACVLALGDTSDIKW